MSESGKPLVVPDLLRLRAAHTPDQIAMDVDGGGTLTYADWRRRSDSVARTLLDRGLRPGERVALLFGGMDWIAYAVGYLGIVCAGGTAVHLNTGVEADELTRRLKECEVAGIVHGADARLPAGFAGWTATVADLDTGTGEPVEVRIEPGDLADILYTSGTTGPAKAISTPHGNLTFGRGPEGFAQLGRPEPLLAPIPLGTTSSATTTAIALTMPATLVLCRVDDVDRMAALIEQHRIKSIMFTPWIGIRMAAARIDRRYDLSCVDTMATASAPLPPSVASTLLEMMPNARLTSVYAAREAVPAVITTTFDPARPLAVGRPANGTELLVADQDGAPVPAGEIGEIWLRCAAPKRMFLSGAERARQLEDDWTRTRDLGYLGADGDLYLFDRDSDAIRSPAGLVSTVEVEAVLYAHPAVAEAAVVADPGSPDGAGIAAFVVLSDPGQLPAVRAYAAAQLAAHQRPTRYELVDALPRGVMGKVLKHRLRDRLAAAF